MHDVADLIDVVVALGQHVPDREQRHRLCPIHLRSDPSTSDDHYRVVDRRKAFDQHQVEVPEVMLDELSQSETVVAASFGVMLGLRGVIGLGGQKQDCPSSTGEENGICTCCAVAPRIGTDLVDDIVSVRRMLHGADAKTCSTQPGDEPLDEGGLPGTRRPDERDHQRPSRHVGEATWGLGGGRLSCFLSSGGPR